MVFVEMLTSFGGGGGGGLCSVLDHALIHSCVCHSLCNVGVAGWRHSWGRGPAHQRRSLRDYLRVYRVSSDSRKLNYIGIVYLAELNLIMVDGIFSQILHF